MKPDTLREYLSAQHAPPHIQEKMERLFELAEKWRLQSQGLLYWCDECAGELDSILESK